VWSHIGEGEIHLSLAISDQWNSTIKYGSLKQQVKVKWKWISLARDHTLRIRRGGLLGIISICVSLRFKQLRIKRVVHLWSCTTLFIHSSNWLATFRRHSLWNYVPYLKTYAVRLAQKTWEKSIPILYFGIILQNVWDAFHLLCPHRLLIARCTI